MLTRHYSSESRLLPDTPDVYGCVESLVALFLPLAVHTEEEFYR